MNNLPLISLPIGAPRAVEQLDELRRDRGDYDFDVRERDGPDEDEPSLVLKEGQIRKETMDADEPITIFVGDDDDYRQTELLKDEVRVRLNSGISQTVLIRIEEVEDGKTLYENTGFFIKSEFTRYAKYGFDILAFFKSEVDGLKPLEDTFDDVSCQGGFDVVYGVETRIV